MAAAPRDHAALGLQYAEDVISGKVDACHWIVKACERHIRDLAKQKTAGFPFYFDAKKGGKVCRFIEQLKHTKGPLTNALISLEPFQCFILTCVFGWMNDGGPRADKRRFRRSYLELPRGSGKSALSSGVALYMLAADGEGGAECYSVATTRQQAGIVARDAQQMARKSPDLMKALGVEVLAHRIIVKKTNSRFEALSSESGTLDGLAVSLGIIDEGHAIKDRSLVEVIESAMGKREQSLFWVITTAGTDRSGICFEMHTYLTKILDRVVEDESSFGMIYTVNPGDLWTEESTWRRANPMFGISVMPEILAQQAAKAMQMPAAINGFRTKFLCEWCGTSNAWMDMRAWDKQADHSLELSDFTGEACTVALDLATRVDIAAKVYVFERMIADVVHYYVFGQYYLPESAIADSRNSQYSGWDASGHLTSTSGDVLDFQVVEDDIIEDTRRFQMTEVAYDPWQAAQMAQRLQAQGASVIEYRNTVGNFSAPMKELEALVRSGRLHHDGNPVLTWMISNVTAVLDRKDNIYPRKERPENKIDGVVALIMALGRIMASTASTGPSVYATRGVITF